MKVLTKQLLKDEVAGNEAIIFMTATTRDKTRKVS